MKLKIFAFLLIAIGLLFKSESGNAFAHAKDSVSSPPWIFAKKIKSLRIPSELGKDRKITGSAILIFIINQDGMIMNTKLARLIVRFDDKTIQCSEFSIDEDNSECKQILFQYKDFIEKYFKKIKIVRNKNSPEPSKENKLGLQIKLIGK
jgi:hypothetical protein